MPELAERGRVEGAGLHAFHPDVRATEPAQAPAQFTGRAGGERDPEHMAGIDHAGPHRIGDAVSDRACLSRAGARQDAHRAPGGQGDLALLRIECGQHGFGIDWVVRPRHRGGCCRGVAFMAGKHPRPRLAVHRSPPVRAILPHDTDSRVKS